MMLTPMIFKIFYDEMCPQWKVYITPELNDQCTLTNHAWVKEPFKVQGRPVGFNAILCEKLPDRISILHTEIHFLKNYHLLSFSILTKKNIQNYLKG